ncbi:MAG: coenzyme F420-0:L-glutamate ligase [Tepidanaerobacteraceae bacterium]|nr:coenzyme F420-0:L-glutamate ligase [Tepidanaerobacteraceae bacterium]
MYQMNLFAPENIPEINIGDNIGRIIIDCLKEKQFSLSNGDIIVIAHKIISKAEGRLIHLSEVLPSDEARNLSELTGKDPHLIQVILQESKEIVKVRKGLIIARHRLGFVCANAAIDQSNAGIDSVVLLPEDPDRSAKEICNLIKSELGKDVAVIVNDSHGRPFREGAIGIAVGIAGMKPLLSYVGKKDRYGYVMRSSVEAVVDEIASAATLLMGQSDESRPVVVIRGYSYEFGNDGIKDLLRPVEKDLFSG